MHAKLRLKLACTDAQACLYGQDSQVAKGSRTDLL